MSKRLNQSGIAPLIILVVLAVLGIGSFATYELLPKSSTSQPDPLFQNLGNLKESTKSADTQPILQNPDLLQATVSASIKPSPSPTTPFVSAFSLLQSKNPQPNSSQYSPLPTPTSKPIPTPTPQIESQASSNDCSGSPSAPAAITTGQPGATFSLSPQTGGYKPGSNFSVDINFNPGDLSLSGADAIILFNKDVLSVSSVSLLVNSPPNQQYRLEPGKVFVSNFLPTPSGKFATINFKVADNASSQNTNLTFQFDPNNPQNTTDSNAATKQITDALTTVQNATYKISSSCN